MLDQGSDNKEKTVDEINEYFAEVFQSKYTKSLFTMYFNEEIYGYARKYALSEKYFPLRHCMAILSIAEVIRLIMNSGSYTSFKNSMDNAINLYEKCENKENLLKHEVLKRYITARVDIKNTLKEENYIQFEDIDDVISMNSPKWFCNNGKGYVLHSQEGSMDIRFKCIGDGNLIIYLRAMDVRDENGNRLPIFIHFRSFRLNGQEMLSVSKECSHDKPYKFECKVKDGDSMQVYIEWEPSQQMYFANPKTVEKVIEKVVVQKEIVYDDSKCEALRSKLLEQENNCEQLQNSISYRLGYIITNPVRIVRKIFKK